MERGGDYKNVQVRHIIYFIKNIDFHIVDPLAVSKDNKKEMFQLEMQNHLGRVRVII